MGKEGITECVGQRVDEVYFGLLCTLMNHDSRDCLFLSP